MFLIFNMLGIFALFFHNFIDNSSETENDLLQKIWQLIPSQIKNPKLFPVVVVGFIKAPVTPFNLFKSLTIADGEVQAALEQVAQELAGSGGLVEVEKA